MNVVSRDGWRARWRGPIAGFVEGAQNYQDSETRPALQQLLKVDTVSGKHPPFIGCTGKLRTKSHPHYIFPSVAASARAEHVYTRQTASDDSPPYTNTLRRTLSPHTAKENTPSPDPHFTWLRYEPRCDQTTPYSRIGLTRLVTPNRQSLEKTSR